MVDNEKIINNFKNETQKAVEMAENNNFNFKSGPIVNDRMISTEKNYLKNKSGKNVKKLPVLRKYTMGKLFNICDNIIIFIMLFRTNKLS